MDKKKYIDVGVLFKTVEDYASTHPVMNDNELFALFCSITAADVVARDCYDRLLAENDELRKERPVRHGRWVHPVPGDGEPYCSVCHAEAEYFYGYGSFEPDFCPNCGADMREVDDGT